MFDIKFFLLLSKVKNKFFIEFYYWYAKNSKDLFVSQKTSPRFFRALPIKTTYFPDSNIQDVDCLLDIPATEIVKTENFEFSNFYNYELENVEKIINPLKIYKGCPILETKTFHNAIYMPQYRCFYLEDGTRINYSCRPEYKIAPKKIDVPDNLPKLSQKFIYGGHLFRHYGHFITECVGRLWYLGKNQNDYVLYSESPRESIKEDFVDRFMRIMNFDKHRFFYLQEPVFLEEVVIPYSAFILDREAFSVHRVLLESLARVVLQEDSTKSDQPLYLSRTNLNRKNALRLIENEINLETLLKENGFIVAHPQELTLEEQIRLINKHKVIVGVWGSSLHNIMFSLNPQVKLICLGDKYNISPNFFLVDGIKKIKSIYIGALDYDKNSSVPELNRTRVIDLDVATAGLKHYGLL
jgi:hypothetical protein